MKNILYLYFGSASPVTQYEKNLISLINKKSTKIHIKYWDWTEELGLKFNPSLKWSYENQNILKPFYDKIKKEISNYDALFIAQTGGLIPEFLAKLNIFKIYNTADDPESSRNCSFPFLKVVDVMIHAGVSYFNDLPLENEFYKRGANNCYYMPIGFYEEMFPKIKNFDKLFKSRNQKLVFVGRPRIQRIQLVRYINHFKNELRIHNRRTPKYQKLFWYLTTGIHISPYNDSLVNLYWQSQIGINMHLSSGPSNVRTYQLPASGVAQLIDCSSTISKIFEPEKELLTYKTITEAIKQSERLINDIDLRYQISKAGYIKARENYNREYLIRNMLNHYVS